MSNTAFDYLLVDIHNCKKTEVADMLGVDKSEIINMGIRKRGVDEPHIEKLKEIFGVPCCYWLDEKPKVSGKQIRARYAKKLTAEVKQKIDSYLSMKKYREGEKIEAEVGYNPYMKEVYAADTDIVIEEMKYMLHSIVYAGCEEDDLYESLFYNRALLLQDMLKCIRNIGIDNIGEYHSALKTQRLKPRGMTLEEKKEYEYMFGKIIGDNLLE